MLQNKTKTVAKDEKSVSKNISTGALKGTCDLDAHRWKILDVSLKIKRIPKNKAKNSLSII